MATNLVIPPLVSEEARLAREQRQQQALGQIISLGQMAASQRARQEVDEDRDFRAMMMIAAPDSGYPDDMRLAAMNRITPKLGMAQGVTLEALRPLWKTLDNMWKTKVAGGDMSVFGPQIDFITANPRLVPPSDLPKALEVAQAVRGQRARDVTDFMQGVAPDVRAAMDRVQAREQEMGALNIEQDRTLLADPASEASPIARRAATENVSRYDTLRTQQTKDQALINQSTGLTQDYQRIQRILETNPKALEQGEEFVLQQAGALPNTPEGRKSRIHMLRMKDRLEPEELRELKSLLLQEGKSAQGELTDTNLALLDVRVNNLKAESREVSQSLEDDKGVRASMAPYQTQLETILDRGKAVTTPEQAVEVQAATQTTAQAFGQERMGYLEVIKPRVAMLTKDVRDLEARAAQLPVQASTALQPERDMLLAEEQKVRAVIKARNAQVDLLTTYHPTEGVQLEWDRRLKEAEVEQLHTELEAHPHAPTHANVQSQWELGKSELASLTSESENWTAGRNRAIQTLAITHRQLDTQRAGLERERTSLQANADKQEATNLLAAAIGTDIEAGKSETAAYRENVPLFPNADGKEALHLALDARKPTMTAATYYAQGLYATKQAAATESVSPQDLSRFARQAQIAAKKKYGFEPSIDEIQKATAPGTSTEGGLIEVKRQQDMFNSVIQTAARLTGEQVGGISISQGPGGESQIQIGGQIKDPVKLGAEILQQVELQTYLPGTVLDPLRRLGERLSASKALEATGPTPPTSPAPLDPLEDFRDILGLPPKKK